MKNRYFVTVSNSVKVCFDKNGKTEGDRFLIKAVFSSESLDKEGFVVDFSKTNAILSNVKEHLEGKKLNSFFNGDFSYKNLLNKIVELINDKLTNTQCFLSKVILEGDNEGYEIEIR